MSLDALFSNETLALVSAGFVSAAVAQAVIRAWHQHKQLKSVEHALTDIRSKVVSVQASSDQYSALADELITELTAQLELAHADNLRLRAELERLAQKPPAQERPANG